MAPTVGRGQLSRDERVQLFGIDCADDVVWKDWQPGVETVHELVLQNVALVTQKLKVKLPQTKEFDMPYPEPFRLAPGMSKSIPIAFRPSQYQPHVDAVEICTKAGSFKVSVKAVVKDIALSVPRVVDFGLCPTCEKSEARVELVNVGTLPAAIRWHCKEPYFVKCPNQVIEVGQAMQCIVEFMPQTASVFDAVVTCEASRLLETLPEDTDSTSTAVAVADTRSALETKVMTKRYPMSITGVGKLPHLAVAGSAKPHVDFGAVFPGKRVTQTLQILNVTPVQAAFRVRALDDQVSPVPPPCFAVTPDSGRVEPQGACNLTFSFLSHTIKEHACQRFEITTPGGTPLMVTCTAFCQPVEVRLSARSINFGEVACGSVYTRTLQLHNSSGRPASYHFVNMDRAKGIFWVDRYIGVIPPESFMVITISFGPVLPVNYLKQVYILVKGAVKPLTLDLLGSAFSEKARPAGLKQQHVDTFRALQLTGVREFPESMRVHTAEEQADSLLEEEDDSSEAEEQTLQLQPKPLSATATFMEMMLETDSKFRDITITPASLNYGMCSTLTMSEKQAVTITNRTSAKVTVAWLLPGETRAVCTPDEKSVFTVSPLQCDIKPHSDAEFMLSFRPQTESSYEGEILEAIVYHKVNRNFRLVDLKRFTPPWMLAVRGQGHTMGGTRNDPRLDVSESNIRFRSCYPGERRYQVTMLTNPGDTQVSYHFQTPVDISPGSNTGAPAATMIPSATVAASAGEGESAEEQQEQQQEQQQTSPPPPSPPQKDKKDSKQQAKDAKETKDTKDGKEGKEGKDAKDGKDAKPVGKDRRQTKKQLLAQQLAEQQAAEEEAEEEAVPEVPVELPPEPEPTPPPFRVWPTDGVIPPHQFHLVVVEFAPQTAKNETPYVANFPMIVDYNESRPISFKAIGRCWEPKIALCRGQRTVTFPPTCSGIDSTMRCEVKNMSEVPVSFTCKIPARYQAWFTFPNPSGELLPLESTTITSRFCPGSDTTFSAPVYVIARGIEDPDSVIEGPLRALTSPEATDRVMDVAPQYSLLFVGHGKGPALSLEPQDLELSAVRACDEMQQSITLVNSSHIAVNFTMGAEFVENAGSVPTSAGEAALKLDRSTGSVAGRCTETLTFTFTPLSRGRYEYKIWVSPFGDDASAAASRGTVLTVRADVQCPTIQIADLRTESPTLQPQSMMWNQFQVDGINALFDGEVAPAERGFQAATGIDEKKKLVSKLKPFQLLFGTSAAGSNPTVVYVVLLNPSGLKVRFSFQTPKNLNLEHPPYWCDVKSMVDEREAHFSWVEEHKLFEIQPRSGEIMPGDFLYVQMKYNHHSIGTHVLPVVFNVHDGHSVLFYLKAHSVAPNVGCLSVRSSVVKLQPVPIHSGRGPRQVVELTNNGGYQAHWCVDDAKIQEQTQEHYHYEVLKVEPREGRLDPQTSTFLHVSFTPLEAKSYQLPVRVEMLRDGKAAEDLCFDLHGEGFHPEGPMPIAEPSFPTTLPIQTYAPVPGCGAALSIELLDFGCSPLRAEISRMLVLVNYSHDFVLTYSWDHCGLFFSETEFRIEPSCGELSPGSHCIIVFRMCTCEPVDISAEITCYLQWTHISLYGQDGDAQVAAGPQVETIHEHAKAGKLMGKMERKHISVASRLTISRFRNLMSSAAGQKFLNQNLHRTALLASHLPVHSPKPGMHSTGLHTPSSSRHGGAVVDVSTSSFQSQAAAAAALGPPPPSGYPMYVRIRAVVADWSVGAEGLDEFIVHKPPAPLSNELGIGLGEGLVAEVAPPEPGKMPAKILEHILREIMAEDDIQEVIHGILNEEQPYFMQFEDSPPPGYAEKVRALVVEEVEEAAAEESERLRTADTERKQEAQPTSIPATPPLAAQQLTASGSSIPPAASSPGAVASGSPSPQAVARGDTVNFTRSESPGVQESDLSPIAGADGSILAQPQCKPRPPLRSPRSLMDMRAPVIPNAIIVPPAVQKEEENPEAVRGLQSQSGQLQMTPSASASKSGRAAGAGTGISRSPSAENAEQQPPPLRELHLASDHFPGTSWAEVQQECGEVDLEAFKMAAAEVLDCMLLDLMDEVIGGQLNWMRPMPRRRTLRQQERRQTQQP